MALFKNQFPRCHAAMEVWDASPADVGDNTVWTFGVTETHFYIKVKITAS